MRFSVLLVFVLIGACEKENEVASGVKDFNKSQLLIKAGTVGELQQFVPKNYQILDFDFGNLTQDTLADCIIALKRRNEDSLNRQELKRPLIILLRDSTGVLSPLIRNDDALYCFDCGGPLGDPFMNIEIEDRSFSIVHYGGGWFRWHFTHYFSQKTDSNSFGLDSIRFMHGEVFADPVEALVFQSELRMPATRVQFESFNIEEDDFP